MLKKLFTFLIGALLPVGTAMAQTLAFPTAEGFGKYASGGRGGEVVEVTNLEDNPSAPVEGSLRWALQQHKGQPITIVFRVSGTIDLKGHDLRSKRDNITFAGQTAPGDGISIKGGTLNLGGSRNIIMRHMRMRVGVLDDGNYYAPGTASPKANFIEGGCLNFENGGLFIIDHCSFSWSGEENIGMYDNDHTTVQWCITSEALYNCGHAKGSRSYGAVFGGKTATYHHNLLAHNESRSPRFGSTTKNDKHMLLDFVNNVNYNWGKKNSCYGGDNRQGDEGLFQLNFRNNYYKPGPARDGSQSHLFIGASYCNPAQGSQGNSYGDWHLSGNYMEGAWAEKNGVNEDNYKAFDIEAYQENVAGLTLDDMKSDAIEVGEFAINMESAKDAYDKVVAAGKGAGAWPHDAHDTRILEETRTGTAQYYGSCNAGRAKGIIDKPSDSGGYPELKTYNEIADADKDGMDDAWETANGFDPTNREDRNVVLKGGYTALEAYLCSLVGETIAIEKAKPFDIIVAQDGSGDCKTINEAIEMAQESAARTVIFVRNGEYKEKVFVGNRWADSKKVISIIGESREGVIITWDDYHGKSIEYPGKGTISADGMTAPTMTVTSPDFYMENVTVRNTVRENVAQAEALYQAGDRQILKNVTVEGYQDTHRTKKGRRYFYYDCTIKGNTDFIYGGGTAYFYKSNIVSRGFVSGKSGGYITAPEDVTHMTYMSDNTTPLYYEFIFNDCDLTAEDGLTGAYLARPWADKDCGTVYMNSRIGSHIKAEGWSGNGNKTSMSFAEYNNTNADGTPVDMSKRVSWGINMIEKDMHLLNLDKVYSAKGLNSTPFSPEEAVVGVMPPANIKVNGDVVLWDAVSGARGYVIYLDGKIIGYTDGSCYYNEGKATGTFTVRAIAANGALSPLSGTEYTLTAEKMHLELNAHDDGSGNVGKETFTLTAVASPIEGGSVSPASATVLEGEQTTFTATPAEGYEFKNWTLETGRVMSTDATYTFEVTSNLNLIANFTKKALAREYHKASATDYEYELVDMTLFAEQVPNAETGKAEWALKNEYTNWVVHTGNGVNVAVGRHVQIDPITDKTTSGATYSTGNMIRVTADKHLSLYIKGTKRAKFYFNGSASTTGHLTVIATPVGGSASTYESTLEVGKKTTQQTDTLAFDLDETKSYELLLKSTTGEMAMWAMKLWPGVGGSVGTEEFTFTATAVPAEGGSVTPTSAVALEGESVTFTAKANEGYEFVNWTKADGEVFSTNPVCTFTAAMSLDLTANFAKKAQGREPHKPHPTLYDYELVDMTLFAEKDETGAWALKNEYTSWVSHTGGAMNCAVGRHVQIDLVTDAASSGATYSTGNMIRATENNHLTLYIAGTKRVKFYFNGSASTTGRLIAIATAADGTSNSYESTLEVGKKTTQQSDTLAFDLDETKTYEILLKSTAGEMAMWAMKLWPGAASGIHGVIVDMESMDDNAPTYNLQGQRVTELLKGQIYVRKGKKFLVK